MTRRRWSSPTLASRLALDGCSNRVGGCSPRAQRPSGRTCNPGAFAGNVQEDSPEPSLGDGYNVIAIPLAAGIAYPWGILLSPAIGAALMSLSTIVVAINASLLELRREAGRETK
jgi:hypothetical protein